MLVDESIVDVLRQRRQLGEHLGRAVASGCLSGYGLLILKVTVPAGGLSSFMIVFASFSLASGRRTRLKTVATSGVKMSPCFAPARAAPIRSTSACCASLI